jgi:hypothetical protein
MNFSLNEMMKAIEERLPFGRRLVQVALFMAFAAFVAECASIISKFAAAFWQTLIRRPADWHVITLGEILTIVIFLVGMWIFTRSLRHSLNAFDTYSLRAQDLMKRFHDQLEITHDQTEKFAAVAERVYRLLEEVKGPSDKKDPPSME